MKILVTTLTLAFLLCLSLLLTSCTQSAVIHWGMNSPIGHEIKSLFMYPIIVEHTPTAAHQDALAAAQAQPLNRYRKDLTLEWW
jgi:hypothetical protein